MISVAEVSLEELLLPHKREIVFSRQRLCPACSGIGALTPEHVHVCSRCEGSGLAWYLMQNRNVSDSFYGRETPACEHRAASNPAHDRSHSSHYMAGESASAGASICMGTHRPKKPYEHAERRPCPVCGARGFVWSAPCETCQGTGTHEEEARLPFVVPAGALHGHSITYEKQGH